MNSIKYLVIFLFGLMNLVAAQEVVTLNSVQEAQTLALEKNINVLNSKYDEVIAKKKTWEITTVGLPQANGTASYNNQLDVPTQVIPAQAFNPDAPEGAFVPVQFGIEQSMSAGITVSQLIFDGSYFVGLKAAKEFAELARKQSNQTAIEVKYGVTQAYYTLLSTKENQEILKGSIESLRTVFKETKATYEQGFIEELDKDRIKLTLNLLEDQYNQVERRLQVAKALLKFQIGINMNDSIIVNDSIQSYLPQLLNEEVNSGNVDYNSIIEYQTLKQGLILQELDTKRYRMQQYPNLGAFFTHSQNAFSNEFDFFDSGKPYYPTTIWGLNLNVPIFNSFGQRAKIMQAKFEAEKIKNQQIQLEQKIDFDFLQAKAEYLNAKEQLINQQDNLALAKKIYDKTLIKQQAGVGSSIEVNDAQTKYLDTQALYINALYQLLINKTNLDKTVGNYDF